MRVTLRAALIPCLLLLAGLVLAGAGPAAPPAPAELTKADATGVLSRMVLDDGGRDIGRIVDVVVDPAGQPRAVVVDVGGFMGVGSRRVAVAWSAVHVPPPGAADPRVTIDMTDEQIRNAPTYNDRSKPATIVGPAAPASEAEPEAQTVPAPTPEPNPPTLSPQTSAPPTPAPPQPAAPLEPTGKPADEPRGDPSPPK